MNCLVLIDPEVTNRLLEQAVRMGFHNSIVQTLSYIHSRVAGGCFVSESDIHVCDTVANYIEQRTATIRGLEHIMGQHEHSYTADRRECTRRTAA